jgi:hypothetical protein
MELLQLDGAGHQAAQILHLLTSELFPGPERGYLGDLIEPFNVLYPGDDFVVITSNNPGAISSNPFDYFCWPGIVSDYVAAANDLLKLTVRISQNRFEGVPICMNIADNQELHKRINIIALRLDSRLLQYNAIDVIGGRWFCRIRRD